MLNAQRSTLNAQRSTLNAQRRKRTTAHAKAQRSSLAESKRLHDPFRASALSLRIAHYALRIDF
jgi:hypothetical protein